MNKKTKETKVKAWAFLYKGRISVAEQCTLKEFILNWGPMKSDETIARVEISMIKKVRR